MDDDHELDQDENAAVKQARLKLFRKLWRAWRTIHEMCQDRGYELSEEEVKMPFDAFVDRFTDIESLGPRVEDMRFSARPSDAMVKKFTPPPTAANPDPATECGTIWVEFMKDAAVGVGQIKSFTKHCTEDKHVAGIMVTQGALSPQARKVIQGASAHMQIDCFMQDDLLVNITHHELVPKHVLLSKEEKLAVLARYRLKETQLPRIMQKDPVARYLGLSKGNVVKIIRNSETAGRYCSFRLCI